MTFFQDEFLKVTSMQQKLRYRKLLVIHFVLYNIANSKLGQFRVLDNFLFHS